LPVSPSCGGRRWSGRFIGLSGTTDMPPVPGLTRPLTTGISSPALPPACEPSVPPSVRHGDAPALRDKQFDSRRTHSRPKLALGSSSNLSIRHPQETPPPSAGPNQPIEWTPQQASSFPPGWRVFPVP
jgi:hypothetical protein